MTEEEMQISCIIDTVIPRLEGYEEKLKKQEQLIMFIVAMLFAPENSDNYAAARDFLHRWYYGGYRSKRVTLYANEKKRDVA